MKNYLTYLIKTKWLQSLIMAFLPTLIFVIQILSSISRYIPNSPQSIPYYRTPTIFITSIVFIMIIVPVVVIFRLYIFRNSKDVDLYYSLPISRQKLLFTQQIFGFLQLVFVWTTMYLSGLLIFTILTSGDYVTSLLILIYFVVILYIAILYGITSFLFLRGNTIVDGIAFIVIFNTAFVFISTFLSHQFFRNIGLTEAFILNPYFSVGKIASYLIHYAKPYQVQQPYGYDSKIILAIIINTSFFLIMSMSSLVLNAKFIIKEKTEQIGRISTSKFGYVSLIPMNLFFAIAGLYFSFNSITLLTISIFGTAGFIGFFIMRRSVRLKWTDVLLVIAPIVLAILIMGIME